MQVSWADGLKTDGFGIDVGITFHAIVGIGFKVCMGKVSWEV